MLREIPYPFSVLCLSIQCFVSWILLDKKNTLRLHMGTDVRCFFIHGATKKIKSLLLMQLLNIK